MPALWTLDQIVAAARQRAGMENSTFIGNTATATLDAEDVTLCKRAIERTYDLVLEYQGSEMFLVTASGVIGSTMTPVSGSTNVYQLAPDFYDLVDVRALYNGRWRKLRKFNRADVSALKNSQIYFGGPWGATYCYRLRWSQNTATDTPHALIEINPTPLAGVTIEVDYVPVITHTASNGVTPTIWYDSINGWLEHSVIQAAIWMLEKEESDTSQLQAELARIEDQIRSLADDRDFQSGVVVDDRRAESAADLPFAGFGWTY